MFNTIFNYMSSAFDSVFSPFDTDYLPINIKEIKTTEKKSDQYSLLGTDILDEAFKNTMDSFNKTFVIFENNEKQR